jgi:anaerobic selenocysteine-containing dehydrogenase
MCACRCGIRVHLRDGVVRYIEGNPEHPLNKGVICAKGASGIMKQVSPALQRGRRTRDRVDLERDRQAAGGMGARTGCERGAQGIPAEPPDLGQAAR